MQLTSTDQQYLLKLARSALKHTFGTNQKLEVDSNNIQDSLKEERATFVTLTKNGNLRGCIGKLIADQELYQDVIDHVYAAAFRDPRFPRLTKAELPEIKIEISILTPPEKFEYKDTPDLTKKLDATKPGIIIKKGWHRATFLPQVWEELDQPENFLSQLCLKAGLSMDVWENEKLDIEAYEVLKFKE